ncbi:MAG: hypothetical protein CBC12_11635 [Candidatus Puniceispirillum sp. TMED52]|nr:hypothetical protein [SAR116 cluster bacterium]OUU46491.1 MAG: hypothetical protein CBC12_11635 [Candidatus Puniceispirillum sp. TMED52]
MAPQQTKSHKNRRHFLIASMATGMSFGIAGLATPFLSRQGFAQDFNIDAALSPRIIGDPDAPILIAEYFSMTCGYCAQFHLDTYPEVKTNWIDTGKARFEYRDFPLSELAVYAHALARAVPEAAYEGMLDILLSQQSKWAASQYPLLELQDMARIAGINEDEFSGMMNNRPYLEGIVKIAQDGYDRFEINSTPTFVINDKEVIAGFKPYDEFEEILNRFMT